MKISTKFAAQFLKYK